MCTGLKFSLEKQSLMMTSAMSKPVSSIILVSYTVNLFVFLVCFLTLVDIY